MSLIFDLLIIIVAVLSVILGIKRGFIKSVSLLLSVAVSIVAVFAFAPSAAKLISANFISDELSDSFTNTVGAYLPDDILTSEQAKEWITDNIDSNENLKAALSNIGITGDDIISGIDSADSVIGDTQATVDGAIENYDGEGFIGELAAEIAECKANTLSTAIAGIVIFILAMIIMSIVMKLLNKIVKLPILNSINKLLGLVFGIVCAAALTLVLSNLAITFMEPLSAYNNELFNDSVIEGSFILSFIRENGLVFF